jgi:hypothetical protein
MAICLKYGLPCFTYRNKIMCYHWRDKKGQAYVLFNNGKLLDHPKLDFKGRKSMQSLDVDVNGDIPIEDLKAIFYQAKGIIDQKLNK